MWFKKKNKENTEFHSNFSVDISCPFCYKDSTTKTEKLL